MPFGEEDRFRLADRFVETFQGRRVDWGPVGYVTFKRCVTVDTPVLTRDLRWRPAGELAVGDELLAFDEYGDEKADGSEGRRKYQAATVLHNETELAECVEVELSDGSRLVCTPDHPWLVRKAAHTLIWVEAQDLLRGRTVSCHFRKYFDVWDEDHSYEGGFLSVAFDGEGSLERHRALSFVQVDNAMLATVKRYLEHFGFEYKEAVRPPAVEGRQAIHHIRLTGSDQVARFLGMFRPPRLLGRYLSLADPMQLKTQRFCHKEELTVVAVRPVGPREVAILSTSSRTHFTGGFPSHNTYSRPLENGGTEEWWQTVRRVVEGTYTLQKWHCNRNRLPWRERKAQRSAQEMYRLIFEFRFLPPGRGLRMMGAEALEQVGTAALMNCAFISTDDARDFARPYTFAMDMSMLGVGCIAAGTSIMTGEGPRPIEALAGHPFVAYVDGKPYLAPVGSFISGTKALLTVTTAEGFVLRLTPDHQLLMLDGWAAASTLEAGHKIRINAHANLAWPGLGSYEEGYLAGLYWADGQDAERGPVAIANDSDEGKEGIITEATCCAAASEDTAASAWAKLAGCAFEELPLQTLAERWELGGDKHIGARIEGASSRFAEGFLRGAFDADGGIFGVNKARAARFFRSDLEDLRTIQRMLLRLGIFSVIADRHRGGGALDPDEAFGDRADRARYMLTVSNESLRPFAERIGFSHTRKAGMLGLLLDGPRHFRARFGGHRRTDAAPGARRIFVATIEGIEPEEGKHEVWDITVEGVHAFDAAGFVAHNCGFDTKGAGAVTIRTPSQGSDVHVVDDSREGWRDIVGRVLDAYVGRASLPAEIDYSEVRLAGTPIKGFGGTAAGPEPLMRCIERIHEILRPLARRKITSSAIVDIMDVIGVAVVSGNLRRSALLALGASDDREFVALKDPDLHPDELMAWRWASNNTVEVAVGEDYSTVARSTAKNGEPGYFWLDNARHYGRMADGRQPGIDGRVGGLNPCVTADTWVLTPAGPRQVGELVGRPGQLILDGVAHAMTSEGFFATGRKPVFRLETVEGHTLRLTADHRVMTDLGWSPAQDLRAGDRLLLSDDADVVWPGRGDREYGRGHGVLIGESLVAGHAVPVQVAACEQASSGFAIGLVSGLFDTAGTRGTGSEASLTLELGDRVLFSVLQRILARLGVAATIEATQTGERLAIRGAAVSRYRSRVAGEPAARSRTHVPRPSATFARLVPDGVEDVYDASVAHVAAFAANGIIVHNCGEQTLESGELCCLVETFPARHASYEEYEHTLKYAYLYGKTVTLGLLHDPQSNRIQLRNRRIGLSQSGIVQSFQRHGRRTHFEWSDRGYAYLRKLDTVYSEWLAVPRSVKITTVKPAGTTSLLPGATPGMHFEHAAHYFRTIRIQKGSTLLLPLERAGYRIEQDRYDPSTLVVYFPVKARYFERSKIDVSMWEQLEIAASLQHWWSDNGVSATITFKPEEARDIPRALELYETRLKAISFLPLKEHGYTQAPYITISEAEYEEAVRSLRPMRLAGDYHEIDDAYCDGDRCVVPGADDPAKTGVALATPLIIEAPDALTG